MEDSTPLYIVCCDVIDKKLNLKGWCVGQQGKKLQVGEWVTKKMGRHAENCGSACGKLWVGMPKNVGQHAKNCGLVQHTLWVCIPIIVAWHGNKKCRTYI